MEHQALTLGSLCSIDGGKIAALFNHLIAHAARDTYDAPGNGKARKVTLQVDIVPIMGDDGSCSEISLQVQAKSSVPTRHTKPYSMGLRPNGMVTFNPDSLDCVNQTTFLPSTDEDDE